MRPVSVQELNHQLVSIAEVRLAFKKMKVAVFLLLAIVAAVVVDANPVASPQEKKGGGGISVDVNQQRNNGRNDGTRFRVDGRQEVFRSNDGRTRAEVYGHWDRTYGGQNHGQRSHGYGGRVEHTWGG